eukprot:TRINITY_DN158_c0_g1_i1.p1 TRINITY_DN158_c0_g1~~TRINITY_DN158_c0_g1_i1.p1  ORF type:complete len:731 (-),score=198.61 TRINITY_DN158_c0_g1_i1:281-2452(-)
MTTRDITTVSLALCCLFFSAVLATASIGEYTRLDVHPHPQFKKTIIIALKQQNLDLLEEMFWAVSDPTSEHYAQYLTHEKIASLIAPPQSSINTVKKWLLENGALSVELGATRDVMTATFNLVDLEAALDVRFHLYEHHSGRHIARAAELHTVPEAIRDHVDIMHRVYDFPPLMKSRRANSSPDSEPAPSSTDEVSDATNGFLFSRVMSRGNAQEVEVGFTVPCFGSSCNKNVNDVNVTYVYRDQLKFADTTGPVKCAQSSQAGKLSCVFTVVVVPFQFITDLHVAVYFDDASSASGTYPFPVVATAPIVPQTLLERYNINELYRSGTSKFSQCVVEFEQQYYSPSDLTLFFDQMGVDGTETPVTVIGENDASNPGGEANLDIQWMFAIAPKVPMVFWSIKANSTLEIDDILTWAYAIGNMTNPPLVNSLSYGMTARNVDAYLGQGYLKRSDIEFQKLALGGLTIIIADGDNGAGDLGEEPMLTPSCKTNGRGKFNPDWPSQSPYVTAIGSTYLTPVAEPICYFPPSQGGIDCAQSGLPFGEVSISLDNGLFWSTGGGFSDRSPQPSYQADAVKSYLSSKNPEMPPSYMYNAGGRAYPDFSTVGHNLITSLNGEFIPIDGTSASAPIAGGIISLLNTALFYGGMKPLGFINPLFYKIAAEVPESFNDVVVGNNRCSAFTNSPVIENCCEKGFPAVVGFDAVSGLGTPNFEILLREVINAQKKN